MGWKRHRSSSAAPRYSNASPNASLTKAIRFRIPEITLEAEAGENHTHLLRLRTAGILLQPSRIPCRRKLPQLGNAHERSHRVSMCRTPLTHPFFRPEEEHLASSENDIVPPLRGWDETMEEPVGGFWSVEVHCESERLSGLLATGVDNARLI